MPIQLLYLRAEVRLEVEVGQVVGVLLGATTEQAADLLVLQLPSVLNNLGQSRRLPHQLFAFLIALADLVRLAYMNYLWLRSIFNFECSNYLTLIFDF